MSPEPCPIHGAAFTDACHICRHWQRAAAGARPIPLSYALCRRLGPPTGELRPCPPCGGKTRLKVFTCTAGHGAVTELDCRTRGPDGTACPDHA